VQASTVVKSRTSIPPLALGAWVAVTGCAAGDSSQDESGALISGSSEVHPRDLTVIDTGGKPTGDFSNPDFVPGGGDSKCTSNTVCIKVNSVVVWWEVLDNPRTNISLFQVLPEGVGPDNGLTVQIEGAYRSPCGDDGPYSCYVLALNTPSVITDIRFYAPPLSLTGPAF
jgi:hypothetical protein